MVNLIIGVGQVTLLIRHAQSLKDKRNILKSLLQKLKNLGFSATECGYHDNPKRGSLGFTFASGESAQVERALEEAERLFVGDYEVVDAQKDIFDYSGEELENFKDLEDNDPREQA